jgi:uncharacterized protein YkwD
MIELGNGPSIPPIPRGLVFLPSVHANQLPVAPVGEPLPVEKQIYLAMALHPYQGRKGMEWNDTLAEAAKDRCISQAHLGWTGHVGPSGKGPNWWVRVLWKYRLPDWYSHDDDANSIESCAHNGRGLPDEVWASWMNSPGHRTHVLGLNDFFAAQTQVGVGFYALPSSQKKFYWSIITAPPEGT